MSTLISKSLSKLLYQLLGVFRRVFLSYFSILKSSFAWRDSGDLKEEGIYLLIDFIDKNMPIKYSMHNFKIVL